ncbi:MAG: fasciclin domain-containing protein [Candidatus Kapabacteria bacterium]|nr:fasciclin domain-containing protein [Candidatus Kapabacteria bacterium]
MERLQLLVIAVLACLIAACTQSNNDANTTSDAPGAAGGQAMVQDDESQKDILKVAMSSKDHTTLVAAIKAAALENTLSNAGPFTVFAPTNAAFDKLPAGTVDDLVKPENVDKLSTILYHHVLTSALDKSSFTDGQDVKMFDGTPVKMTINGDNWSVGGAKVIASVRASNGWVHVVDGVLVP